MLRSVPLIAAAKSEDHSRLVAALAIRLVEFGHARVVNLDVECSAEALVMARMFVTEVETRGLPTFTVSANPPRSQEADLRETALHVHHGPPVGRVRQHALASVRNACAGHSAEGHGRPIEGHPGDTRVCGICGATFRVNPRHAAHHCFCSASCRSKARHRRGVQQGGRPITRSTP